MFKGETQRYVVKLPKSGGAGQYFPKIPRVPGTRGTRTNSSPDLRRASAHDFMVLQIQTYTKSLPK